MHLCGLTKYASVCWTCNPVF